jgi:hypothetical protein
LNYEIQQGLFFACLSWGEGRGGNDMNFGDNSLQKDHATAHCWTKLQNIEVGMMKGLFNIITEL